MQFSQSITVALATLASTVLAQTASPAPTATGVTPSQSSAFNQIVSSYASAFTQGPAFTNLGINLALNLPGSVFQSVRQNPQELLPIPTTSFDLASFATSPPTTFPPPAWQTYLSDADLTNSIGSLRTSAVYALATQAQNVIGTTASLSSPTATPSSTSNPGASQPRVTAGAVFAGFGAAWALAM